MKQTNFERKVWKILSYYVYVALLMCCVLGFMIFYVGITELLKVM